MSAIASTELSYLVHNLAYGFCPGCSHGQVVDALGNALEQLAPVKEQAVVVSDIGCVGLVDKHFDLNTFHGLHGRSVTYGTGIKLARPELSVFVLIGDGGTGIGGHHLIQAARRNVDITVVVFNNFNYGMTGGEHSTTTPQGARTSSTPTGNAEAPLDIGALAMAAGAGFVARLPAFDKELPAVLERAARFKGFALVDVWEICTAYFMPNNKFKKKQLLELSESQQMPFGVLRDHAPAPRPAAALPAAKRIELEPKFDADLQQPFGILLAGAAGQKVKSAGTSLGRAAISAGLHATQKDDYPITVKTGHSVAEVVVSPRPIRFTGIEAPDVALVLTPEGAGRVADTLRRMPASAAIYADASLELPETAAPVTRLDYRAVARQVGRDNLALWALGHMLARHRPFPAEALADVVQRFTPAAYRDGCVTAVDKGVEAAGDDGTPIA